MARASREAAAYERLMYRGPEPRVPVNRLSIRDRQTLLAVEAEIVALRAAQGLPTEALQLDVDGYLAIHHHLFQDIYHWAGRLRPYTTSRNMGTPFAAPENIRPWMERQFARLADAGHLQGRTPPAFALELASIANELNAAHPFIEGNGRVLRLWIQIIAEQAGYVAHLDRRDAQRWNEAFRLGFLTGEVTALQAVILDSLSAHLA